MEQRVSEIPKEIVDLYDISFRDDKGKKTTYIPIPDSKGMIGIHGPHKIYIGQKVVKIECNNGTWIELFKSIKNLLITI